MSSSLSCSSLSTILPSGLRTENKHNLHASRVLAASPAPHMAEFRPQAAYISLLDTSTSCTSDAGGSGPNLSAFRETLATAGIAPVASLQERHTASGVLNVKF